MDTVKRAALIKTIRGGVDQAGHRVTGAMPYQFDLERQSGAAAGPCPLRLIIETGMVSIEALAPADELPGRMEV